MKLITLLLAMTFSLSGFTKADQTLRLAIDNLNYSLTVEWDQNDMDFYTNQMETFANTLNDLQSEGVQKTELIKQVVSFIQNKQLAMEVE
jgi:hypothetical protein